MAVVNREFASKIFGFATNAVGKYYKVKDGSRIQVVAIVEDGKYASLAEDPIDQSHRLHAGNSLQCIDPYGH